jgi:hypothetical protein
VRGAHNQADHERVAPRMRDTIRVVFLIESDGRLGPSEPCRSDEGVNSIHRRRNPHRSRGSPWPLGTWCLPPRHPPSGR